MGMATGIICSILLITKSDKKPSNRFLALGILGFVWLNTKVLLHTLDLWEIHGLGFFPNGVELAIPPLFYFYLASLLQPDFRFTWKEWLHFIPFFLSQSYAIFVYAAIMQAPLLPEKQVIANSLYFDGVKQVEDHLMVVSGIIYLCVGYRHIRNYNDWLMTHTSDTRFSELRFLKNGALWLLVSLSYTIINLILNPIICTASHYRWQIGHLITATLVYYLGLVGYKNSDLIPVGFSNQLQRKTGRKQGPADFELVARLDRAIENDRVHLNPRLSLQELAKILEVSESALSHAINTHYQKNFRSFIKELRVIEVKRRLLNGDLAHLSLLGLAKECGFNSEASFYRIFKAETGMTPKKFLAENSAGAFASPPMPEQRQR